MTFALRDMKFVLHDVLDYAGHYRSLDLAEPPDESLINAILDEAARFAAAELEPRNASGDLEGCRFESGAVHTPSGFREAYAAYCESGWPSLTGDPAYGGQGLPDSLGLLLEELCGTANMAWTMYPGLSRGAIAALQHHGSDQQKRDFLPPLVAGRWTGTMCLTEPHAGSDVGLARTRAEPAADGSYRITGTKIFISAGEHDLAENIVHLVLARLADSPPGTRGISMFVVPRTDLDGTRNAVACGAIEEKMGIHGNATCVLNFDGARGYLVGERDKGMSYMFTMMNAARIVVGLQGICAAQAGLAKSAGYALERLQMRSLSGPRMPDKPADPIIVHPDVRRMLLSQRAIVEGGRALVYFTGQLVDRTQHHPDGEMRETAQTVLDFLTPVTKGFLTELGFESVNHALQVFGGHGFIRDNAVEQLVRDARITLLYEGTTQIQALDLLGRKVLQTQGRGLLTFADWMRETAASCREADLGELAEPLSELADEWIGLSLAVGGRAQENVEELGAAAVDYLFYSGYVILAYLWGRTALAARTAGDDADGYRAGKIDIARFYFQKLLPRARAHKAAIDAGAATLLDIADDAIVRLD